MNLNYLRIKQSKIFCKNFNHICILHDYTDYHLIHLSRNWTAPNIFWNILVKFMYCAYSLLINIFYSFYNWDSHIAFWNSTPNYQVIDDNPEGLLFKYKRDRKILNVDPKVNLLLHLCIFPNFIVFLSLFYY